MEMSHFSEAEADELWGVVSSACRAAGIVYQGRSVEYWRKARLEGHYYAALRK